METTLNVPSEVLRRIDYAARATGIPRREIISLLVKKMMDTVSEPGRMGKLVRYQDRRGPGEWRRVHVKLRVDDYEYFQDLRRFLKMSVSLILVIAVKKYLPRLLKNKKQDNYQYRNYVIARENADGVTCWKLFWGFPRRLEKFINFTTS